MFKLVASHLYRNSNLQKKIAVLGGGLSGLTLAKELEGVFDVTAVSYTHLTLPTKRIL